LSVKSRLEEFAFYVAVTVVATVIADNIGLVNSFAILISQSFALQSLLLWAALVVIAIRVCHWLVAFVRRKWSVRDLRNKILNFLKMWDRLGEAYRESNRAKISQITDKLIVLYTPVAPYVRSQAKLIVTPAFSNIQIQDFDMIGNLLMGSVTKYGYTIDQAYDLGRMMLLAALGSLGHRPE